MSDHDLQAAVLVLLTAGFLALPLAMLGRPTARRFARGERAPWAVSGAGLLTVAGFLLVRCGGEAGPVVADRPAVWLATQAAALTTVIAAGIAACSAPPHSRVPAGTVALTGLVFLPWAMYQRLLLP